MVNYACPFGNNCQMKGQRGCLNDLPESLLQGMDRPDVVYSCPNDMNPVLESKLRKSELPAVC
jgi:hypothetical protein